jgi:hypothetical protein
MSPLNSPTFFFCLRICSLCGRFSILHTFLTFWILFSCAPQAVFVTNSSAMWFFFSDLRNELRSDDFLIAYGYNKQNYCLSFLCWWSTALREGHRGVRPHGTAFDGRAQQLHRFSLDHFRKQSMRGLSAVNLVIWTALPEVSPTIVSFSLRVWIQAAVSWLPPCLWQMISLELSVQSRSISSVLDPNHEWKPEIDLFSLVGWG